MSIVSIPYTFTNGLPLDATQINANFQALAGGLGSGLANSALTNITATSLTLGTISYADTGAVYGAGSSLNGYVQDIVQNTNAGSAASADYVVSNNLGTASAYYGDFGINSSTFSGTGSLSLPNATYLYSANGDLVLGTYTANAIHIVVGNGATDAMTVSATGVVALGQPLPVASGGTGLTATPTNGQLLIGNGAGYSLSTLTAGIGITITNSAGRITISSNLMLPDASNGTFIAPGSTGVASPMILKLANWAHPGDFGVPLYGDGTSNDGPAFLAAAASGRNIKVPKPGVAWNFGTTSIPVQSGQFIEGDGVVAAKSQATTETFALMGYDAESGVSGFALDMTGAGSSSAALRYKTATNVVWRTRIERMKISNHFKGIAQDAGTYIVDNQHRDIEFTYAKGTSVAVNWSQGFQLWEDLNIDGTLACTGAYLENWAAFEYDNLAGIRMSRCDHTGQAAVLGGAAAFNSNIVSFKLSGGSMPFNAFAWLDELRSESSCGLGIEIVNMNFIHAPVIETFTALGLAIYVYGSTIIRGGDWYVRGAKDQVGTVTGAHGITFDGCTDVKVSNPSAVFCNGDGVRLNNTNGSRFLLVQGSDNVGYDFHELGTSDDNYAAAFTLAGTGLGKVSKVGANTWLVEKPGVTPAPVTVASLPAASTSYVQYLRVSDALSPVLGSAVVGGGSVNVRVYNTGSTWIVG